MDYSSCLLPPNCSTCTSVRCLLERIFLLCNLFFYVASVMIHVGCFLFNRPFNRSHLKRSGFGLFKMLAIVLIVLNILIVFGLHTNTIHAGIRFLLQWSSSVTAWVCSGWTGFIRSLTPSSLQYRCSTTLGSTDVWETQCLHLPGWGIALTNELW